MKATVPYPFQLEDVNKVVDEFNGRALIAWEQGLGKSFGALLAAVKLKADPIIIICPSTVKEQWRNEALKHLGLRAEIATGRTPPRRTKLANTNKIIIVNYDILAKVRKKNGSHYKGWAGYLSSLSPELLIFDEGHRLGNPRSNWTQAAKMLAIRVPHILVLTGTPFRNNIIQLWSPLNFVRPDAFSNAFKFAWKYTRPKKIFGHWTFKGSRNLPKLRERLLRVCMVRRLKADVMPQLPKRVRTILPVDITNRSEYNHCQSDFLGWLATVMDEGCVRRAARAEWVVRTGYLRRLASEGKIKSIIDCTSSFLEESEEKLLIFTLHKFMIKALKEKFPHISTVIDGSVIGSKRQAAIDIFQTRPSIRLLFGQIAAAGEGCNLTAANNADIVELPWTPAEISQAFARIHRIGQTQTCFERFIIAKDTIEVQLCKLLQRKQNVFNEAIDGKKGTNLDIMDELSQALLNGSRK